MEGTKVLVKAFVAIGGLLVVALLGLLVAPFLIDWSAYRTDFEREAGRILGREVTVRGAASAQILPFPSVTFTDVVVAGPAKGEAPLLVVDRFRMDAELAPYLSGEIRIFSMVLERPHLTLALSGPDSAAGEAGAAGLPTNATVVLENVAIEDGRVTIEDRAAGEAREIAGLNARLSARSLAGPFSGTGRFELAGLSYEAQLSSGAVQPEGGLPLRLTLDAPRLDAEMIFDGTLHGEPAAPRFEGGLRVASPLPPPPNTGEAAPAARTAGLLPPMTVTSKIVATPAAVVLEELRAAVGGRERPYVLTGNGRARLGASPRFDLSLEGEQVDVDAVATGTEPGLSGSVRQRRSFEERLEAMRQVLAAVPRPSIPGAVKLSLPVVLAGDTTIRDVALTATPAPEGWRLDGLKAELPGRTRLEATGTLALEPLGFSGDLLVASRQPSGFSDWLTGGVDPALRRLGQAGLSAEVALTRQAQRFDRLELDIGGETMTGRFARDAEGMSADLSAGGVDLDALAALSRLFSDAGPAGLSTNERIALKLGAGPVRFSGAAAQRIDADLALDAGTLAVKRLDVSDLAGADLRVSGTLTGLDAEAGGSLSVALSTSDPARLSAFLATRLPPSPALAVLEARAPRLGPLSIEGTVATATEKPGEKPTLRVSLAGRAAASAVTLDMALGNGIYAKGTSGRFGLEATLTSPEPAGLLGQLGLETLAADAPAPLGVTLQLSAGATGPVAASASVEAPGTRGTAEGTLDVTPAGIASAEFGLNATSEDLSPWLTVLAIEAGQPRTGTLPVSLDGNLSWFTGDWALKGLSAEIAGSSIGGELQKAAGGPVTGEIEASSLSVPWLATLVTGRAPDSLDPAVPWPAEGFDAPLLPPVEAVLDINVAALDLGRGATLADAAGELDLGQARVALENLSGSIAGGYLRGGASLENANGVVGLSLDADFSGLAVGDVLGGGGDGGELSPAELEALVAGGGEGAPAEGTDGADPAPDAADGAEDGGGAPVEAEAAPVSGTLDATLKLEASGQSYAALVASLSGAGRASVEDGAIAGLPTNLLPSLLSAADAEGFEPSTDRVASLVAKAAEGASYPVAAAETTLAITGGVARFSPVTVETAGETLTLSGAVDLRRETVAADLRLALEPGEEAVAGADPAIAYALSGPLTGPSLATDVQPLATYLGARAVEREEARVEAIQEQLQERLRLRREARFYRAREAERLARAEATREAERLALERARAAEERRAEAAQAARREIEERRAREAAPTAPTATPTRAPPAPSRAAPSRAESRPAPAPLPKLDLAPPATRVPSTPTTPFPSLPGVEDPLKF